MGSEYCLGTHGEIETPQGLGVKLMAYEMSGAFDVFIDLPKESVELDAWENAVRVNLWDNIDPIALYKIGMNIKRIASYHMLEQDIIEAEHGQR